MAYANILVALDISDEAGEVLECAKGMMADKDAQLSIIHVIQPLAAFYVDMFSVMGDQIDIDSQAVKHASALLAGLAKKHGVDAKAIDIALGKPSSEIRRKAEKAGADLIVLGTHGRHGLGRLLGSTANGVLHGASCDVLAVRVSDASP